MEVPIRKLLLGRENHIHLDTVANPDSIAYFVDFAKNYRPTKSINKSVLITALKSAMNEY